MSEYQIFQTNEFLKSLKKIAKADRERLSAKLHASVYDELKQQPYFGHNIKKLRSWSPDTWRYRLGNYRLFYLIDEANSVVVLTTILHRQSAYKA